MDWNQLEAYADDTVDTQFGEQVVVTPYLTGNQYAEPMPDTSRSVQTMVGYVVGRNTQVRAAGTAAAYTKRAESDQVFVVQRKYVVNPVLKGDRIQFLGRNETWEISYVESGPTNRYVFHLLGIP